MRPVISIYTTIFFILITCPIAFANIVEDPVLYLDASDNPAHPKAWENLGTEGGELLAADKAPELEEGTIKIPALGIDEQNVKYYTTKESLQTFGGPPQKNTPLFFEDWTLEFLCRRNGDFFVEEHHFGTSGKSIVAYQDGKEVSKQAGFEFDKKLPINDISIGANSYDERRRTFNGSFAIVRAYDKALTEAEVNQNISGTFAVDPADKLSTTWAKVKRGYK